MRTHPGKLLLDLAPHAHRVNARRFARPARNVVLASVFLQRFQKVRRDLQPSLFVHPRRESSAQHLEVCSIGAQERPNSPRLYTLCHYLPLCATIVTVLFALSRRKCMASRDFCGEVSRFRGQLVGTTTGGVSWEGIVEGLMSDSRSQLYRMPLIS